MYLLGRLKNRNCYLGIDKLAKIDFMILGDIFLQHHAVIFDKKNNKIGFINNHRTLSIYFDGELIPIILNILCIGMVVAAFMILVCRKKKKIDL